MSEVIKLAPKTTIDDEIKQAAIDMLRKALAEAESGNVSMCIVILRHPDGTWSDERSGSTNFPDAVGRLEIVKQAWITSYLNEPK